MSKSKDNATIEFTAFEMDALAFAIQTIAEAMEKGLLQVTHGEAADPNAPTWEHAAYTALAKINAAQNIPSPVEKENLH